MCNHCKFKYIQIAIVIFFLLAQPFRLFRIDLNIINFSGYLFLVLLIIFIYILQIINSFKLNKKIIYTIMVGIFLLLFYSPLTGHNYIDIKYFFILIGNIVIGLYLYIELFKNPKLMMYILNVLGLYIVFLFVVLIITLMLSEIRIIDFVSTVLNYETYLHSSNSNLYNIYEGLRVEKYFFNRGPREYALDGIQLAIFPFIYVLFYHAFIYKKKNKFHQLVLVLSYLLVIVFNSRGMLFSIFLFHFLSFIFKNKIIFFKLSLSIIIIFPFLIYILSKEALRGRMEIFGLFINKLSLFGNGIGASQFYLSEETGFLGSFHNIHLEFIFNFGYLVYLILLVFMLKVIGKLKYFSRPLLLFFLLTFVSMASNGNLVDYSFIIPAFIIVAVYKIEYIQKRIYNNGYT